MRIQYEVAAEKNEEIEKWMEKCGIRTKKSFLDDAVNFFILTLKEREKGFEVGSRHPEKELFKEIIMPAFMIISKK